MTISDIKILDIPKIHDEKGNLSVVEGLTIPFEIKRVYFLYNIPSNSERTGHAQVVEQKVLIAISGSFDVIVYDGFQEKTFSLNKPNVGLLIPNGIWREMNNFSAASACLVISSTDFDESDYNRDKQNFKLSKNRLS